MSRDLERAVKQARKHVADDYASREAWEKLHDTQRKLAAARNQAWAEPLDLGVAWDAGAPLPHLLSNGSRAVLVCRAAAVDPHWDGTYATVVSPTEQTPTDMLEFSFAGCSAVKIGGPNDEALQGHSLYDRGLDGYRPHIVHNSDWIVEQEAINSAHPQHEAGWHGRINHYFFVFHDEMFEALAATVEVRTVRATMAQCVSSAAEAIVQS